VRALAEKLADKPSPAVEPKTVDEALRRGRAKT
jgi:hypothetical protein